MLERLRGRVAEGMQVRSADGERLGKVVSCQTEGFLVEKGFLFPKDLFIPYDRITSVGNGEILISLARASLDEPGPARAPATTAHAGASNLGEEVKGAARAVKEALVGGASQAQAATGNGEAKLHG